MRGFDCETSEWFRVSEMAVLDPQASRPLIPIPANTANTNVWGNDGGLLV